ncbi:2OG-Fe(II) oxygenase [Pedomonas mirosovicensis]|uniref:2OG-Fe(II) oxygenase n=1 Tax=Pedomonas mirosovicensis TaxID=2908641 RepID=UPI0021670E42|nr:2OG-Fe(II) oxygenase family protein [Pedomonas mirosovicensis]MCH8684085.1 2OG-Fe(II) oxygenase [Pedomonas mirosovicensis]
MVTALKLRGTFDWVGLASHYHAHGWVQIPNILARADAEALHRMLAGLDGWHTSIGAGKQSWSVPSGSDLGFATGQAHAAAQQGFAYIFEHIPAIEAGAAPVLESVRALVTSEAFLDIGRRLTGDDDICFADAQACRYGPGHFLTTHNDDVAGKHRRAAYVLNLTPQWRADWGGLLLFHDDKGGVTRGLVPAFNVLNIFKVPVAHSVSAVAPFAPARRYSVTGWLRTQPDA